jgi:dienelactone hydrolase
MSSLLRHLGVLPAHVLVTEAASLANAQAAPFYYPAPAAGSVTVTKDVQFGRGDTLALHMDVFRPANATGRLPILVIFYGGVGAQRSNGFSMGWANAAASNGMVAVLPDIRQDHAAEDFRSVIDYLYDNASTYRGDRDAIAVYAGSGNVYSALPLVEDPNQRKVKAAVIYYGTGPVSTFRRDLPIMFVRAGLDRPGVNGDARSGIVAMVASAIAQNAPVTVINNPAGHHAFEMFDDGDVTRDVIDRTIDFVKHATSAAYQASLQRSLPEAAAAAHVIAGDFKAAASTYASIVSSHPDDSRLRLAYGEALLGDNQFAEACGQFDRLKNKGLGPRDLGLPAARACLLKGDSTAAIGWLQTIPKRFLPTSLQDDSLFAGLKSREDFRRLFMP